MITRQQLRQFIAVVDAGNFTRAAEQIGVTQPSLSSAIRQLETELGAPLFERQRPAVRLTSAGNRLLPLARRILREFLQAERETAQLSVARRAFILGVIPTFPTPRLAAACRKWGEGDLVIKERDGARLRQDLRQGHIDAAIMVSRRDEPADLQLADLFDEDYRVLLPAGHSLAGRDEVSAEELANEVMIARRSCEVLSETSHYFTARGVRPRFAFKSHNDERAIALVAAGLGITVAPASLAESGLTSGGVVALRLAEFDRRRRIALAMRADDYRAAGHYRQTCDALLACFLG